MSSITSRERLSIVLFNELIGLFLVIFIFVSFYDFVVAERLNTFTPPVRIFKIITIIMSMALLIELKIWQKFSALLGKLFAFVATYRSLIWVVLSWGLVFYLLPTDEILLKSALTSFVIFSTFVVFNKRYE